MLAGDNAGTAAAIARSCGILDSASQQQIPASNGSASASSASSRPSSNIGADSQNSRRGKAPMLTLMTMVALTRSASRLVAAGVLSSAGGHTETVEHAHAGLEGGISESGRADNGANSAGAAVMTGPEFRERVLRADGSIDRQRFTALWPALRVMGRCSPQDKYTIVRGEPPCRLPWGQHRSAPWEALMLEGAENAQAAPSPALTSQAARNFMPGLSTWPGLQTQRHSQPCSDGCSR